ncbi:MAG: hypothetical protein WA432_05165 [Candidatus Babeliaceae bacterium]
MGKLFIIAAPSGTGKTTVVKELVDRIKVVQIIRIITYTSRLPRPGEIEGVDYHFISEAHFIELKEQGFFIAVSTLYDAYYGVSLSYRDDLHKGLSLIAILDRAGAREIAHDMPNVVLIWLFPPDFISLKNRLMQRATDTIETIEKRLSIAQKELQEEAESPFFHYHVSSENIDKTVLFVEKIILNELGFLKYNFSGQKEILKKF